MKEMKEKKPIDKNKLVFWSRFCLYVLIGYAAPIFFLAWRFELFNKISKIKIGLWELIIVFIILVGFIKLIQYVKKGLPYSLLTQVLNGIAKVIIPLMVCLIIVNAFKNSGDKLNYLVQFLVFLIACETVAIVVNPFPKWIHDNHLEEQEHQFRKVFESLGVIKPKK